MAYRGKPTYSTRTLSKNTDEKGKIVFPPFVLKKLLELLQDPDDAEDVTDGEVSFADIEGSIDYDITAKMDISKYIMLWIASHDKNILHVYTGGSSCWITPDNHYMSFDVIAPDLLPPMAERDPSVWWILGNVGGNEWGDVLVHRIHIVPSSEMKGAFPDLPYD